MYQKFKFFSLMVCFFVFLVAKSYAITWNPPTEISDTLKDSTKVCIDNNDNNVAVATWTEWDGSNARIAVSIFSGESWSVPTIISAAGFTSVNPEVAINENDNAMITWVLNNGSHHVIQASFYNGVSWSPAVNLSSTGDEVDFPKITMNDSDNAFVTWTVNNPAVAIVQVAYFSGGTWSAPESISTLANVSSRSQISMNNANNAFAIWQSSNGTDRIIETVFFDGVSWSTPTALSGAEYSAFEAKVLINTSGDAMAKWECNGPGMNNVIQAASFDSSSSTWSLPITLSSTSTNAGSSDLAYNDLGTACIVWKELAVSTFVIASRVYLLGTWNAVTTLSDPLISSKVPKLAMNNSDTIIATFLSLNGSISETRAVSFESRIWGSPQLLSNASTITLYPSATLNNFGDAFAAWEVPMGVGKIYVCSGTIP